ncbi:Uncharacterised protein r2_g572 [Pycnogonum litorale]
MNEKVTAITDYINFCEDMCSSRFIYYEDRITGNLTTKNIKYARRKREWSFKNCNEDSFIHWSKVVDDEIVKLNNVLLSNLKKSDSKEYWQKIKTISKGHTDHSHLHFDNITVDDLNKFFLRFETGENDHELHWPSSSLNVDVNFDEMSSSLQILNETDILKLLKRTKYKNSRGPDGISSSILYKCRLSLTNPIKCIFNQCINQSAIPEIWKNIKVTPIRKTNSFKITNPNQVRPIGQTSALLKLFEYFLKDNLKHISNSVMNNQFAYQECISTADAIGLLTGTCSKYLDATNSSVRILFLDYSSAFNTVCRQTIIDKIAANKTVPIWLQKLIFDYLSVRKHYVQVGKIKSKVLPCKTGVIQGAVLSPFFFNLITDPLTTNTNGSIIIKYADDTVLVQNVKCESDLNHYKETIKYIANFSSKNSLILNTSKTKELIISSRFSDHQAKNSTITRLNDENIAKAEFYKYLGICIDDKLNFDHHVDNIISKSIQKLRYASRILKKSKNKMAVKDFVTSCIFPTLTYCSHIYIHYIKKSKLNELIRLLRRLSSLCRLDKDYYKVMMEESINKAANKHYNNIKANNIHPLNNVHQTIINKHYDTRNKKILPPTNKSIGQKSFIYKAAACDVFNTKYFSFSN